MVHLPGYMNARNPRIPGTEWVHNVRSFVTLGSPIDKYLVLWRENYRHLTYLDWMDNQNPQCTDKIRHLNYSDEQDPVGHELNILKTTCVWNNLFQEVEDIAFVRYLAPGLAHVKYWQDHELWRRIVDLAIDGRSVNESRNVEWFRFPIYIGVLAVTYLIVPLVGWGIGTVSLSMVYSALVEQTIAWPAVGVTLISITLTLWLMRLMIMWRQMLIVVRGARGGLGRKFSRKCSRAIVRVIVYGAPAVWLWLLWTSALIPYTAPFLKHVVEAGVKLGLLVSICFAIQHAAVKVRWLRLRKTMALTYREYWS